MAGDCISIRRRSTARRQLQAKLFPHLGVHCMVPFREKRSRRGPADAMKTLPSALSRSGGDTRLAEVPQVRKAQANARRVVVDKND